MKAMLVTQATLSYIYNVINDSFALAIHKPNNVGPPYTDVVTVVL